MTAGQFDASTFNGGSMDDVAAQQAVNAAAAYGPGGGIVWMPGSWTFRNPVNVPRGVRVLGNSRWGSIVTAGRDTTLFNLNGYQSSLEDIACLGWGFGAGQPVLTIGSQAVEACMHRVRGGFGFRCFSGFRH